MSSRHLFTNLKCSYFKTTIKERVTQGGASGAFFFFSKDEVFLAKSCTRTEFEVLVDNAEKFSDYFESPKGKHSFINKVYLILQLAPICRLFCFV